MSKDAKEARSLGVTFRKDGSFIRLAGYMDEFAEYAPLFVQKPPLKLILREIVAVNSHGIRKWIRFIQEYGVKALELHEVPAVFIDAANMLPEMVSMTGNMKRVKSVVTPHTCFNCAKDFHLIIPTDSVTRFGDAFEVLAQACPRCGGTLEMAVEPEDHFMFLIGA